ncbi:GNAT family N-acetyltransferase [Pseudooceanicola sp. LIPI14-2-Ac024]|uniref:GNAT family N-acetyltransferase n=1 Tax=Pseudooceanicola sp. LIPI14-2-Ac024 TaxID=3344875 RepID=UPI0035D0E241
MEVPRLRPFAEPDLDWLVEVHDRLYRQDEGFDGRFAEVVRAAATAILRRADPRERGIVAEASEGRVGSIFSTRYDDDTGQIRMFLVEPEWRGTGLAPRMLAAALDVARANGARRMVLWTHESHRAACALYARTGWVEGARRPVRSYGRGLVEVTWSRTL